MTTRHSAPSKLESFLAIFGAALGFSVLFMFALSSFVNNLYETNSGHASGEMQADSGHPAGDHGDKTKTTNIITRDGQGTTVKPTDSKPASPAKPATPATAKPKLGKLLAEADPKKGAKVAKKCFACHDFTKKGKNKVGPVLYALIGRKIATGKGFKYSSAMKTYAGTAPTWSYDNLGEFLQKPKKLIPKTKMAFAGIRKKKDLLNLMAWLRTNADKPAPLPLY